MSLFYLDTSNNIVLANYTSTLGNSGLTLTTTVQISATGVHSSSQLAAVYLDNSNGYRLYYQTTSGTIQEMVGVGSKWKNGTTLSSATANGGSPLTVSSISAPGILQVSLFYVDSATKSLFNTIYNGGWSSGAALGSTTIALWDGANTALATIAQYSTSPKYLRTYYVADDNSIHETLDPGAAGKTWNDSDSSSSWPSADFTAAGSIAGIAWDDQVRVYYVSNSTMTQLLLKDTVWYYQTDL